jgi:diguanylate cyclase (GGDEF)-like protein/PAS domain S-box-containing protein
MSVTPIRPLRGAHRRTAPSDTVSLDEALAALALSESRLASLLKLSADWVWEQDAELRMTYVSEGMQAATGIPPEVVLGRRRDEFGTFDAAPEAVAEYREAIRERRAFRNFVYALTRADGSRCFIRISGEPITDAQGRFAGYRGVGSDVTAATLAERQIERLARFDALTGLPNRSSFQIELGRAIARARRSQQGFAVGYMDLDRFKNVNDSLGHEAGDALLREVAARVRGALRETDFVARVGGDEFVLLFDGAERLPEITTAAERVLAALAPPITLSGCSFDVTGSLGLAVYARDGEDATTLLQHADAAMYLAKERGKNNVQFYTAELAEAARRQFELEAELRHAIGAGELLLHFQPKLAVASGRVIGAEALVRWKHPRRGMVSPGDFIPLAEERGLIVPLGRWVLREACRQMAAWRREGRVALPVSVNVSARQFASDSLLADITSALAEHGIEPTMLEIELTESALMADADRAARVLGELHAMGVKIAIDDFGTGYSSLSYLKRFPAQTVKIDRSFIRGLPQDGDDAAITQAVIAMAHSLKLCVVAEGVETAEQLATLQRMGCDEAQGFLLGRPVEADAMGQRLAEHAVVAAG